jgi:hypothetical protein
LVLAGALGGLVCIVADAAPAPGPASTVVQGTATSPRWSYAVRLSARRKGWLEIEAEYRGLAGPLQLCTDMEGSGRWVTGPRVRDAPTPGSEGRALERDGEDPDCWQVASPGSGPLRIRYSFDLAGMAEAFGNPDWATQAGEGWIFSEHALLLRPEPLPEGAPIEVTFDLPAGVSAATPWRQLPGGPWRYSTDSDQLDAGSYVAFGKLALLPEIPVRGGAVAVAVVDLPRKAPDAALREWVASAARPVAAFYRGLPGGRMLALLVPIAGSDEPDGFGTTRRPAHPSTVLYFGADSPASSFAGDWMAPHELFHAGNPRLERRLHWLTEGASTYYQEILRGRAGLAPPEEIWGGLARRLREACGGDRGVPLREGSAQMRRRHRYAEVYWSGACLCLQADVAIRERSQGKRSLDDLLRALRAAGEEEPLAEEEVVRALDEATGGRLVSRYLDTPGAMPIDGLLRRLGIEELEREAQPGLARLSDGAPLARIRRAILAPDP